VLKHHSIKTGDILISSPMNQNMIFAKSVIFILSADKDAIFGVIVNKALNSIKIDDIIKSIQDKYTLFEDSDLEENNLNLNHSLQLPIYFGGPVNQSRGIILHSSEYKNALSISLIPKISLSTSTQIFVDIIKGKGPIDKMLMFGYASWNMHQITEEIKRNDWVILFHDSLEQHSNDIADLLFKEQDSYKWNKALKLAGINLQNYSNTTGNA
jgi:putative transcriptional regulator